MKKVLIMYAKYGGGHLSAACSVQNYIEKNYKDVEVNLVDCVEYISKPLSKATTGIYKQAAKSAPWAWKKIYYNSDKGVLSSISNCANRLMSKKLYKLLKKYSPDIVISTHPFASQMTSYIKEHKKIECKLATIMTDFASHNQWLVGKEFCDLYFVSNEQMKQDLIKADIPSNKIHITGVPLSYKFSDEYISEFNKEKIYNDFNLKPDKKVILFFGGGALGIGKEKTVQVLKSIIRYIENYQVIAISGKNKKMNNEFLRIYEEINNEDLHIMEYTQNVPELMSISNLVITKPGGLTSSESLASALPMININPIPGQEEENAEFLEKSGVSVWLKKEDDIDKVVDNLLRDSEKLELMRQNCLKIGKKNSTREICSIIFSE